MFLNTRRPQILTRMSVKISKRVVDRIILRLSEKKCYFLDTFLISCGQNLYLKMKIAPIHMTLVILSTYLKNNLKPETFFLFDNIFLEENNFLVIKQDTSH